jgi:SAM-dependent methyltransferase
VEWRLPPAPRWADHHLDLYWQWRARGGSLFVERGVFSSLAIEPGARVLDLCCGDGFNSRYFYAPRACEVVAIDVADDAIDYARRYNAAPNVRYMCADARDGLPAGPFDNVVWDSAIEYFEREEARAILAHIAAALGPRGVLSGYAPLEGASSTDGFVHNQLVFREPADLNELLSESFPHVLTVKTHGQGRVNAYFFASAAGNAIPLSPDHPGVVAVDGQEADSA